MKIFEKSKAIELRKLGKSIREIVNILSVSKSTVSLWVKDILLSKKAKKIIENKMTEGQKASIISIKYKTKIKEECATNFAKSILSDVTITKNIKMIICAMIYECEGCKTGKEVAFTNSDPYLMSIFIRYLRQSFDLDESKFRVCLHLHKYHNVNKQLKFWSETLKIPIDQFSKPFLKMNSGKNIKTEYQGCARIRYYDVLVFRKLRALSKEFIKLGL